MFKWLTNFFAFFFTNNSSPAPKPAPKTAEFPKAKTQITDAVTAKKPAANKSAPKKKSTKKTK